MQTFIVQRHNFDNIMRKLLKIQNWKQAAGLTPKNSELKVSSWFYFQPYKYNL